MASVYRAAGRGVYQIKFTDQHGVSRRVSSGAKDKRIAEALAAKLEHDSARPARFGNLGKMGNL